MNLWSSPSRNKTQSRFVGIWRKPEWHASPKQTRYPFFILINVNGRLSAWFCVLFASINVYWGNVTFCCWIIVLFSLTVTSCQYILASFFSSRFPKTKSICTCEHPLCQTSPVFMDFSIVLHWYQRRCCFVFVFLFLRSHLQHFCHLHTSVWKREKIVSKNVNKVCFLKLCALCNIFWVLLCHWFIPVNTV